MHSKRLGWILLSPTLVILGLFGVFPFIYVLWMSFHEWNPFAANPTKIFNWAENYRKLVFDEGFIASLEVTAVFVFFAVVSEVILGYFLARAFFERVSGPGLFSAPFTSCRSS